MRTWFRIGGSTTKRSILLYYEEVEDQGQDSGNSLRESCLDGIPVRVKLRVENSIFSVRTSPAPVTTSLHRDASGVEDLLAMSKFSTARLLILNSHQCHQCSVVS